jgi:hypothetical protein
MVWSLFLTLALALALPLAVGAWLAGGHVTPEQAAGHALALSRQGSHQHAPSQTSRNPLAAEPGPSTHLAVTARASLALGPLLTTQAPTGLFTLWQALIALSALLGGLIGWRRRPASPARRLATFITPIPFPPPRLPRLVLV